MAFIRKADDKGRITIPGLARSQVLIEEVSEHEFRVRRVEAIPTEEARILKNPRALAALQALGKDCNRLDECSE